MNFLALSQMKILSQSHSKNLKSQRKIQRPVGALVMISLYLLIMMVMGVEASAAALTVAQIGALNKLTANAPGVSISVLSPSLAANHDTDSTDPVANAELQKTFVIVGVPEEQTDLTFGQSQVLKAFASLSWLRIGFTQERAESLQAFLAPQNNGAQSRSSKQISKGTQLIQYDAQYNDALFYRESAEIVARFRETRAADLAICTAFGVGYTWLATVGLSTAYKALLQMGTEDASQQRVDGLRTCVLAGMGGVSMAYAT